MLSTQVRCFLAVAKHGSLNAASEQLFVAKTAISRQILQLEKQMGTLLFIRHSKGMSLTHAGRVLSNHLHKNMCEMERALTQIRGLQEVPTIIRVACPTGLAFNLMPSLFARFYQHNPKVSFILSVGTMVEIEQKIRRSEVDVALQLTMAQESDVEVMLSLSAPMLLMISSDHPFAKQPVCLADLTAYPLALPDQTMTSRQLLSMACTIEGVSLQPTICCNNLAVQYHFMMTTENAMVISSFYSLFYKSQQDNLMFKALNLPKLPDRMLQIQVNPDKPRSDTIQAFLDFLRAELSELSQQHPPVKTILAKFRHGKHKEM